MMGWFNVGSFVLGLIAWILPIISLLRIKNRDNKNWSFLSFVSISACAISLYFQLVYNNYLVKIGDWAALMDTTEAIVFAAEVLVIVTLILNGITFIVYRKRA